MIEEIVKIMKQHRLKSVAYDYARTELHITFCDGTSVTFKEKDFFKADLEKLSEKYGTK